MVETRTGANASPSVEISCVSCALTESIDVTPKFSRMIPVTLTLAPLGKARTTLDGEVVRINNPEYGVIASCTYTLGAFTASFGISDAEAVTVPVIEMEYPS